MLMGLEYTTRQRVVKGSGICDTAIMKSFRFEPVRWMTWLLAALLAVQTVNAEGHLLPDSWTKYLLGASALLTLLLGSAVRARVTALAAPRMDEDTPLVPLKR